MHDKLDQDQITQERFVQQLVVQQPVVQEFAAAVPLALELDAAFVALSAGERLRLLRATLPGRIVFTTSLGLEDQVLTHLIAESGLDIVIATLDTGRLFPESHDLWAQTEARYGLRLAAFVPERASVEALVEAQGVNGFRDSVSNRTACCDIRKVAPLGHALAGASGWITGLRADQSAQRGRTNFVSHDRAHNLIKANPLLDWTREQAGAFAAQHHIPVNPLHAKGFLSIGCAPCTRAVQPGEPERAGRWWWEQINNDNPDQKECGLHVSADGSIARGKPVLETAP
jgi:phosphoadenosine phosphosulfate reductase